ncbi:sugar phosphate isomerase/epimerase [Maribacter sp. PR1]|uniref:Sugar phosphate isomerase/epimerase family protein n=1 Tax=Maribacter cobaltidurans TaxID=1178778 RepID=A0ABU7IQ87_9FLAO|nr:MULTISPECIES: sugar phosphate isomerase/epimerase family protein [Maribacter]MDC6387656.1 sugar phosphate isomerase/epimerase [Maribacter sp. PR1]MEE1975044.1 sugar phosphate isomerase/epimerase family protein [Maribacter cobaltidurans]
MELAIHNWMRAESLEHTLTRISKLGYTFLEIQGAPENYDAKKIKPIMDAHGIKCWGSVTLMLEERNLLAKDPAQRKMSIQYVKDLAKMVADLGGSVISLVPATVGKIIPDATPEQEWEWAVEGVQEIYKYTEDLGLRIGIEPINRFETYFINRGAQALALAEAVGPNCGVCLDTFHMNIEEEDMFSTMKQVGDRLVNFHVADNNRMAPGMGHLNWKKIIETLQQINYDKVLSVEFCAPLDRTPANPFPNSIETDPKELTAEQKKFLEDHGSSAITDEFYTMLTKKSMDTLTEILK